MDELLVTEVGGRRLQLSNLDKVLFGDGTTKAELIAYYLAIAPTMLPHLRDRCLTRLRFPEGVDGPSFYEKNAPRGTPAWVRTAPVLAQDSEIDYVVADEAATLVWLANLAAIELHAPQWRTSDASTPPAIPISLEGDHAVPATTLVVDLDPGEGVTMHQLCRAAMLAAHHLAQAGLIPFVKTTGSKGLQVMAAIAPTPWRKVVEQSRALGADLAARHPDLLTTTMAKRARAGLIYWDHLQNRGDRNTICVYSCRGRARPSVSTPLTWDEVAAVGPDDSLGFTIHDVPERVQRLGDLWEPLLESRGAPDLPSWTG